jgi:hypothetical protein
MPRTWKIAAALALALVISLTGVSYCFGSIRIDDFDVGFSAVGGTSVVDGAWRDDVDGFSDELGQDTTTHLSPAFSASLFATTHFGSIWRWGASLGAGTWFGRVISEGADAKDRFSTIAGIGVELVPSVGLQVPFGPGRFGADFKLGFGILASPLWVREAWSDMSTTSSYGLSFGRRLYFLTGADLDYVFPVGLYSVGALLSADMGFASFDSSGASVLGRFGVGIRVSRPIDIHKGKAR